MITEKLSIGLKGMAMGMAEVVPGVSGGTVAFVSGIYEQLLLAITAFKPALFQTFKDEGFKGVWTAIQGNFLVALLSGMAFGLIVGVFLITWLIETYPPIIWAFFFGLILASVWYIGKLVKPWTVGKALALALGVALALAVVMGVPTQGNHALWFVFVSGIIAISAMLLPGISGSFVLLLMGMYSYIVPSVRGLLTGDFEKFWIVFVFGLGCLTGLATFSRLLQYLFQKFPQPTLALLTGFMLGSLYKLWPWRYVSEYAKDAQGNFIVDEEGIKKVLVEANVWPAEYITITGEPAYIALALIASVVGVALIYMLSRLEGTPEL